MSKDSKVKAWLSAFRLRTLPLAASSIIVGSALALSVGMFRVEILILALLTAILLQILSNLANDYGDSKKGTDNENRVGPKRSVQSGIISPKGMKKMVFVFIFLSLISGISLVYIGTKNIDFRSGLILFVIGLGAIFSAIRYTIGKNPYGYNGLGDLFVFLFFGLTGVLGSYFLHTNSFDWDLLFPASALGLLSTGVLNLNNMRDVVNDKASGKNTLVVLMGRKKALVYHYFLIITGLVLLLLFTYLNFSSYKQLLFIVVYPFFIRDLITISKYQNPKQFDPQLKKLAISTLLLSLLFAITLNI